MNIDQIFADIDQAMVQKISNDLAMAGFQICEKTLLQKGASLFYVRHVRNHFNEKTGMKLINSIPIQENVPNHSR